jgi:predicted RNase H-like HicB family nuclease
MSQLREYAIVITKANRRRNWCGYSPDVPGVVATDLTAEACAERLRGALEQHISVLAEEGLEIPEPSTVVRTVKMAA